RTRNVVASTTRPGRWTMRPPSFNEDVLKAWRTYFQKVTKEDIDNYLKKYCGSEEQKEEMIGVYEKYKGDFGKIQECVIGFEDVDELKDALDTLIAEGSLEKTKKYEMTTSEKKMNSYKRKAEKEAKEAENVQQESSDLVAMIQSRQKARGASFLDALEAKYSTPSASKRARRGAK
uniref:DNAJC9 HTH domain-containing protein n=1 Tax=Caenorhabditis japonica TaxID=281687 RepID=A0A8R1IX33_CAEJA